MLHSVLTSILCYIVVGYTDCYNHNVKTVTAHCYEYDKSSNTLRIQTYDLESLMKCIIRACDYKSAMYNTLDCFKRTNNTSFQVTVVIIIIMNITYIIIYLMISFNFL